MDLVLLILIIVEWTPKVKDSFLQEHKISFYLEKNISALVSFLQSQVFFLWISHTLNAEICLISGSCGEYYLITASHFITCDRGGFVQQVNILFSKWTSWKCRNVPSTVVNGSYWWNVKTGSDRSVIRKVFIKFCPLVLRLPLFAPVPWDYTTLISFLFLSRVSSSGLAPSTGFT